MLHNTSTDDFTQEEENKCRASKKQNAHQISEKAGQQLRAMRKTRRLSIRALSEQSGLSVNTLSLIENGKTSPSVSTLHQLAQSLDVPIAAFFAYENPKSRVSYQKAGERQQLIFAQGQMEKLSAGVPRMESEPFITKLEPGANSGETPIVFPERQFIYCLEGHITYIIEGETYPLTPGDSLIFDSYTPHIWRNTASTNSSALLVVCPEESMDDFPERYLMP